MLAMEAGGAGTIFFSILHREFLGLTSPLCCWLDIIELGLPFTDPIADGPTIQKANTVRIRLVPFEVVAVKK